MHSFCHLFILVQLGRSRSQSEPPGSESSIFNHLVEGQCVALLETLEQEEVELLILGRVLLHGLADELDELLARDVGPAQIVFWQTMNLGADVTEGIIDPLAKTDEPEELS